MASCEIELVIDTSTTTNPTVDPNYSHNNNDDDTGSHDSLMMIIAKRSLIMSLNSILTKLHAGYFRISLSLGGQALLWKTFAEPADHDTGVIGHVRSMFHPTAFLVLWSFSLFVLVLLSIIYLSRCLFYFNMVKAEFLHHVGVNYLFALWISWLLLLQSAPCLAPKTLYLVLWWVFSVSVVRLDVKIYGQWFTKGKRFLPAVRRQPYEPVIGDRELGRGSSCGSHGVERECGLLVFTGHGSLFIGAFCDALSAPFRRRSPPVLLRPVFFLFLAAPGVASLAWESIVGDFDTASKMLFFLSLFLFTSLISGQCCSGGQCMRSFNVAWWAYSFPVTVLAIAAMEYAYEVKGVIANWRTLYLDGSFSVGVRRPHALSVSSTLRCFSPTMTRSLVCLFIYHHPVI